MAFIGDCLSAGLSHLSFFSLFFFCVWKLGVVGGAWILMRLLDRRCAKHRSLQHLTGEMKTLLESHLFELFPHKDAIYICVKIHDVKQSFSSGDGGLRN